MRNFVTRRKRLLPGALPVAAALLAGCSGAASSGPPPLGTGGSTGRACTLAPHVATPVSMVLFDLDNKAAAPVTVQRVSLPGAHGLAMTQAWLVPLSTSGPQLGVGQAWPPENFPLWPARIPADGSIIQPGQVVQLAFGVYRTTPADGSSDGPAIVYQSGSTTYTLREQVSLAAAGTSCTLSTSQSQSSSSG